MAFSFKRFFRCLNQSSDRKPDDATPDDASYQRSFSRFSIEFEVIVSFSNNEGEIEQERSELHDVSGGGAMFITNLPEKYYPGQHLKMDIFLTGTENVRACIKTEASVVRIHPLHLSSSEKAATKTGVAVKFHKPFKFERMDRPFSDDST